jgi:lysylphosphatidylglycerol synthetase-like protein (DUF2156 family)
VFDASIANLKHKIDLALKSTIGAIVALAAALVALGFFCAALFLWLETRYGAITATLILGGIFAFLALVALIVVLILRRSPPPPPPPARKSAWWADPALLATALDITKVLGRKRITTAVLVGAFVLGVLLNRAPHKDGETPGD